MSSVPRLLKTAFLSLGSNLGDRAAHLEDALARLAEAGVTVRRRSSLYETEPVGANAQRWFVNCVVEIDHKLGGLVLLAPGKAEPEVLYGGRVNR